MSRAEEGDACPGRLAAEGQRAKEEDHGDGLWLHGWAGEKEGPMEEMSKGTR